MSYIVAFILRPFRTLHLCWRYCTLRGGRYIIYMKSGNKIHIDAKSVTIKKDAQNYITSMEWEHSNLPTYKLFTIDIDEIESIVIR